MAIVHPAAGERLIRRDAFARCPFSIAIERAQQALASARFSVVTVEDFTDAVRRHEAVEFRWAPRLKLFPSAQALLTVRPHAPQGSQLQLSIVYIPPAGTLGARFDAILGKHIAWLTAGVLLRGLQRAIRFQPKGSRD